MNLIEQIDDYEKKFMYIYFRQKNYVIFKYVLLYDNRIIIVINIKYSTKRKYTNFIVRFYSNKSNFVVID